MQTTLFRSTKGEPGEPGHVLFRWFCVRAGYTLPGKAAIKKQPLTKGSEDLDEMTTAELNQYLENIAKLIESNAKDADAAAQIVRDSKVKA